jgi:hypothetical protein
VTDSICPMRGGVVRLSPRCLHYDAIFRCLEKWIRPYSSVRIGCNVTTSSQYDLGGLEIWNWTLFGWLSSGIWLSDPVPTSRIPGTWLVIRMEGETGETGRRAADIHSLPTQSNSLFPYSYFCNSHSTMHPSRGRSQLNPSVTLHGRCR